MTRESSLSLRSLPSVDRLLGHASLQPALGFLGREWITQTARQVLEKARAGVKAGAAAPAIDVLARQVAELCERLRFGGLCRVINATGVLLHTNLGRAALPPEAIRAALAQASGSTSVEMELASGERGNRYETVQMLLGALTGCESSVVVNNNAAAVLLVLNTFARGRDVILSRGEMIEIGGSFRLPEIIRASGANLIEVGTTNRTHLGDFRKAVKPDCGLLMKAHCSNYRVVGFTTSVSARELMRLSAETGVPVYEDLGSGSLVDLSVYGLTAEPTVQQVVASGIPLISFSGDKLLGGPQAGVIVGKREYIDQLLENHLLRALRVDKVTMALLEKSLQCYLDPAGPAGTVPTHGLLSRAAEKLRLQADEVVRRVDARRLELRVAPDTAAVGGGACPTDVLPTWVVEASHPELGPDELASQLRRARVPVVGRIRQDRLCLDMRTVFPHDVDDLVASLTAVDVQFREVR